MVTRLRSQYDRSDYNHPEGTGSPSPAAIAIKNARMTENSEISLYHPRLSVFIRGSLTFFATGGYTERVTMN